MISEITCVELKKKLDNKDAIVIIDVREDYERDISTIEDSIHIPLAELEDRLDELNKDQAYILQCRSGGRSASATQLLKDEGFKDVKNLIGGINEWAKSIDKSLQVY
jgi:rhodanese-related sulfurtransferase